MFLARTLVDLMIKFYPLSVDKMDPESSQVYGPPPKFLTDTDDVLGRMFGTTNEQPTKFGADQAILVRDNLQKEKVISICGGNALVFTALESKGMEFDDCLIFDFFATSPIQNTWRLVYEILDEYNGPKLKFDSHQHSGILSELKKLYVLITRTKKHLVFIDSGVSARKPLLDLWTTKQLITQQEFGVEVLELFQDHSNASEWEARGKICFEKKIYDRAQICFYKSNNDFMRSLSEAKHLLTKADYYVENDNSDAVTAGSKAVATDPRKLYEQANSLFESLLVLGVDGVVYTVEDIHFDIATCHERLQNYSAAGTNFEVANRLHLAVTCYKKVSQFKDVARILFVLKELDSAVEYGMKCRAYEWTIEQLQRVYNTSTLLSSVSSGLSTENVSKLQAICVRKAALYYHHKRERMLMMSFVQQFPSFSEQLQFLQRYGHTDELITLYQSIGDYAKVADLYMTQHEFVKASNSYATAERHIEAAAALIKHERINAMTLDFLPKFSLTAIEEIKNKLQLSKVEIPEKISIELDLYSCSMNNKLEKIIPIWQRIDSISTEGAITHLQLHILMLSFHCYSSKGTENAILAVDKMVSGRSHQTKTMKLKGSFDEEEFLCKCFEKTQSMLRIIHRQCALPSNISMPSNIKLVKEILYFFDATICGDTTNGINSNSLVRIPANQVYRNAFTSAKSDTISVFDVLKYAIVYLSSSLEEMCKSYEAVLTAKLTHLQKQVPSQLFYNRNWLNQQVKLRPPITWYTKDKSMILQRMISLLSQQLELPKTGTDKEIQLKNASISERIILYRSQLKSILFTMHCCCQDIDQQFEIRNNSSIISYDTIPIPLNLDSLPTDFSSAAELFLTSEVNGRFEALCSIIHRRFGKGNVLCKGSDPCSLLIRSFLFLGSGNKTDAMHYERQESTFMRSLICGVDSLFPVKGKLVRPFQLIILLQRYAVLALLQKENYRGVIVSDKLIKTIMSNSNPVFRDEIRAAQSRPADSPAAEWRRSCGSKIVNDIIRVIIGALDCILTSEHLQLMTEKNQGIINKENYPGFIRSLVLLAGDLASNSHKHNRQKVVDMIKKHYQDNKPALLYSQPELFGRFCQNVENLKTQHVFNLSIHVLGCHSELDDKLVVISVDNRDALPEYTRKLALPCKYLRIDTIPCDSDTSREVILVADSLPPELVSLKVNTNTVHKNVDTIAASGVDGGTDVKEEDQHVVDDGEEELILTDTNTNFEYKKSYPTEWMSDRLMKLLRTARTNLEDSSVRFSRKTEKDLTVVFHSLMSASDIRTVAKIYSDMAYPLLHCSDDLAELLHKYIEKLTNYIELVSACCDVIILMQCMFCCITVLLSILLLCAY